MGDVAHELRLQQTRQAVYDAEERIARRTFIIGELRAKQQDFSAALALLDSDLLTLKTTRARLIAQERAARSSRRQRTMIEMAAVCAASFLLTSYTALVLADLLRDRVTIR